MNRIDEARKILASLGMPEKQQTDLCCYALLSMLSVGSDTAWHEAKNEWIRIHDILQFTKKHYGIEYAENSRETFRKQAMHQFRNAALSEDNGKATNSPNYRYRITDETLNLIRSFGTAEWEEKLKLFKATHESLIDLYASKKIMKKCLFALMAQILRFLPARIICFKKQLLKNLHLDLRQIANAYMWEIRLQRNL